MFEDTDIRLMERSGSAAEALVSPDVGEQKYGHLAAYL